MIFHDGRRGPAAGSIPSTTGGPPWQYRNRVTARFLRHLQSMPEALLVRTEPVELLLNNGTYEILYAPAVVVDWSGPIPAEYRSAGGASHARTTVFEVTPLSDLKGMTAEDRAILRAVKGHFLAIGQHFRVITERCMRAGGDGDADPWGRPAPVTRRSAAAAILHALRRRGGGPMEVGRLVATGAAERISPATMQEALLMLQEQKLISVTTPAGRGDEVRLTAAND